MLKIQLVYTLLNGVIFFAGLIIGDPSLLPLILDAFQDALVPNIPTIISWGNIVDRYTKRFCQQYKMPALRPRITSEEMAAEQARESRLSSAAKSVAAKAIEIGCAILLDGAILYGAVIGIAETWQQEPGGENLVATGVILAIKVLLLFLVDKEEENCDQPIMTSLKVHLQGDVLLIIGVFISTVIPELLGNLLTTGLFILLLRNAWKDTRQNIVNLIRIVVSAIALDIYSSSHTHEEE